LKIHGINNVHIIVQQSLDPKVVIGFLLSRGVIHMGHAVGIINEVIMEAGKFSLDIIGCQFYISIQILPFTAEQIIG
jgi:hypothetical protein